MFSPTLLNQKKFYLALFCLTYWFGGVGLYAQSSGGGGYFAVGYSNMGQSVGVQDKGTQEKAVLNTGSYDRSASGFFVNYASSPNLFGAGGLGYNFLFSYTELNVTAQIVQGSLGSSSNSPQTLNLGTSAQGRGFFVVPRLFYLWGQSPYDSYFMISAGLGLGGFNTEGDLYLTENTENTNPTCFAKKKALDVEGIQANCQKRSFTYSGMSQGSPALSLNVEKKWGYALLGLNLKGVNASDDQYDYSFATLAVNLGVAF